MLRMLWLEITGRCQLPVDRTTGRHAVLKKDTVLAAL